MAAAANVSSTKCPTYKNSDSFDIGSQKVWEEQLPETFKQVAGDDHKMNANEFVNAMKAALDKSGLDIVLGIIDALSDNKPQLHKTWGGAPPGSLTDAPGRPLTYMEMRTLEDAPDSTGIPEGKRPMTSEELLQRSGPDAPGRPLTYMEMRTLEAAPDSTGIPEGKRPMTSEELFQQYGHWRVR